MSQRDTRLLWLRDMLGQLSACQRQLQHTRDAEMICVLTDNMIRELESCRRLCQELQRRASLQQAC